MRSLLTALPGLGCAVIMAGMMLLMSRGTKSNHSRPTDRRADNVAHEAQLDDLRREIDRLRAEVRGSGEPTPVEVDQLRAELTDKRRPEPSVQTPDAG